MGKSKSKKQAAKQKAHRLGALEQPVKQPIVKSEALTEAKASTEDHYIDPEDVEIAVDVLSTLMERPEALSDQRYKQLKRVGWDFGKTLAEQGSGVGASIHSKISHLLSLSLYRQALVLLFDLYVNRTPTKLGSLQRWVRDCDATSRPGRVLTEEENEERNVVLRCLDMVLRVCGSDYKGDGVKLLEEDETRSDASQVIRRMKLWNVRDVVESDRLQEDLPLWPLIQKGFETEPEGKHSAFYPIQVTPGHLRRPPNPREIHLSPFLSARRPAFSIPHPAIPSCNLLANILPPATCQSIIEAANSLGWEQDQAAGGSAVDKTSVLAHNVVWLADEEIKPFVQEKFQGGKVRGINRRFRVYRYGPKQVYRPHIDGAWPAAGIDAKTGEYLHDSSPKDDPLWSRYTLLIYLNSDINPTTPAGATTFFLPSLNSIGTLLACPIAPVQGAVLVFPHGDARGSLLHEGSPVGDGGWKVVIRTDLLYEAEGFGEFAPTKRKVVDDDGGPRKVAKFRRENIHPILVQ
ncbi:hypothetical protein DFP72DRAFT_847061 [Ephemerocybe angulata]|uniref:Fe2OG dioxygenase domain-containing protein n=1 Tax=Ephemerocybe angulata TaxID=980116 RepID=A0A8H6HYW9_9AGAR|nr:hypothetical protein DFP72DRAFT_847061 [Tulosesus angulatus]